MLLKCDFSGSYKVNENIFLFKLKLRMLTILKNLFVFFKFRNFCEILLHKKRVGNIVTKFKVQNTTVSSVEDLSDDYNNRQQPIYKSAE